MTNIEVNTVQGFGEEWSHYNQSSLSPQELKTIFDQYFDIFPWELLNQSSVGADFGCGSGRWSQLMAPHVGQLHLVDASPEALKVARHNLRDHSNVYFHHASIEEAELPSEGLDFAFSLGVLHHMPDTARALRDISSKLKTGAPLLVYLYYAFDNRPIWYRALWSVSDIARQLICRTSFPVRKFLTKMIGLGIYWPTARLAFMLDKIGILPSWFPLSYYRDRSLYIMQNDALDRFGTRLEQRFSRLEIESMLKLAGLGGIHFSDHAPYWCAVAYKEQLC